MTDAFEKWIRGMDEDMYEDWLDEKATEAQEEKALNIRTPISQQEEEDLDAMQGDTRDAEPEPLKEPEALSEPSRVTEIYDNRDIPPTIRKVTIKQYYDGRPPIIQTPVEQIPVSRPTQPLPTPQPAPQPAPQPKPRPSIRQRISGFISKINIFRRKK